MYPFTLCTGQLATACLKVYGPSMAFGQGWLIRLRQQCQGRYDGLSPDETGDLCGGPECSERIQLTEICLSFPTHFAFQFDIENFSAV